MCLPATSLATGVWCVFACYIAGYWSVVCVCLLHRWLLECGVCLPATSLATGVWCVFACYITGYWSVVCVCLLHCWLLECGVCLPAASLAILECGVCLPATSLATGVWCVFACCIAGYWSVVCVSLCQNTLNVEVSVGVVGE